VQVFFLTELVQELQKMWRVLIFVAVSLATMGYAGKSLNFRRGRNSGARTPQHRKKSMVNTATPHKNSTKHTVTAFFHESRDEKAHFCLI